MTKATLIQGVLRIYNRKDGNWQAYSNDEKTLLKGRGFAWDNSGKCYFKENASQSDVDLISKYLVVETEKKEIPLVPMPVNTKAKAKYDERFNVKPADTSASLQAVIARLESLFDMFNKTFFNNELERPVITVSPDTTKGAYGWCTSWKAWKGEKEGGYYEINMCAEHLSRPFDLTCCTLIHEMVHLKNLQDGVKDTSRGGTYHNKRFKEVAENHGLVVEKTEKGYSKTTMNEDTAKWLNETFPDDEGFKLYRDKKVKIVASSTGSSIKYVCPYCGMIVRATKEVKIICGDCEIPLERR